MEIVGQGARERADHVVAPVLPEFYVENLDLKHVAGRGALDRNRPGQDMAGHHALVFGMDLGKLRRDVKLGPVRHTSGPPLMVSMVTSSPLAMVSTGFSLASKKPQWQVSGLACRW